VINVPYRRDEARAIARQQPCSRRRSGRSRSRHGSALGETRALSRLRRRRSGHAQWRSDHTYVGAAPGCWQPNRAHRAPTRGRIAGRGSHAMRRRLHGPAPRRSGAAVKPIVLGPPGWAVLVARTRLTGRPLQEPKRGWPSPAATFTGLSPGRARHFDGAGRSVRYCRRRSPGADRWAETVWQPGPAPERIRRRTLALLESSG